MGRLILAARRDDFEGWMQILVFIAMVVVYSLSGILKAKMKKAEPEECKEKPMRPRPASPVSQPQRRKITRFQPAVDKIAAKAERPVRFPSTEPPSKSRLYVSIPQPHLDILESPKSEVEIQKLPEFIGKAISEPEGKLVSPAVPAGKYLDEIFLDYADPDELKRAILHYEILGKPLSLRIPDDKIV